LASHHDHLECVSGSGVIVVDALAHISGFNGTGNWAWSIHAPSVLATPSEIDLDIRWWKCCRLHTSNLQVHAPTLGAVFAPGANLVTIHLNLEGVSSPRMVGVDALAHIPGIHVTSHGTWRVHTQPVATAASNDHINWGWSRWVYLLFWSI
jgi:hypothetical protein